MQDTAYSQFKTRNLGTTKDTVYSQFKICDLGTFNITVTWDAGGVKLGYIYLNGKRTDVGWNYETRIWTL